MTTPNITLNNGVEMPQLGLGVYQMDDQQVRDSIPLALKAGYRLIDTASRYYNEKAVGQAIEDADIARDELFITTKLWFKDHGYDQTKQALQVSLDNLGRDYLDLWLIHQPFGDYYGAWRAMEDLMDEGLVRAIGVSNYFDDRYFDLISHHRVVPAVNQRETNPLNQQIDTQALLAEHGTALQAWSPLGQGNPDILTNPVLQHIAESHGKTVPQVVLRWLIQRDIALVVKSTHKDRLQENIDIFDFQLTDEQLAQIASLDSGQTNGEFDHTDPRMLELLLSLD